MEEVPTYKRPKRAVIQMTWLRRLALDFLSTYESLINRDVTRINDQCFVFLFVRDLKDAFGRDTLPSWNALTTMHRRARELEHDCRREEQWVNAILLQGLSRLCGTLASTSTAEGAARDLLVVHEQLLDLLGKQWLDYAVFAWYPKFQKNTHRKMRDCARHIFQA